MSTQHRLCFRFVVVAALVALVATLAPQPPPAAADPGDEVVHFVVDTSGSMSGTPLAQAKGALNASIDALPASRLAGLREFSGPCGQGGNLLVDIDRDNRDQLRTAIEGLTAGGGTPTPEALQAGADDLPASGERTIVFISDGVSTCGDPCPVATSLAEQLGVSFKVFTVGFRAPDAAEGELACIADATGGQYYSADNEQELADAIGDATGGVTCPDLLVAGVRGSGQTTDDEDGFGEPVSSFVEALLERLEVHGEAPFAGGDITTEAIDYAALDVPAALSTGDLAGYQASHNLGRTALEQKLAAHEQNCDTPVVLAGYSQGADVIASRVGNTPNLWEDGTVDPWPAWDQVAAVVLFGDPLFNPSDPSATGLLGNAFGGGAFGAGVIPGSPGELRAQFVNAGGTVQSWCRNSDPVCDYRTTGGPLGTAAFEAIFRRHSRYHEPYEGGLSPAQQGANFACQQLVGEVCASGELRNLGPGQGQGRGPRN